MLIKRDVTSGVHDYCSLLEYFAIAVTTYTVGYFNYMRLLYVENELCKTVRKGAPIR